PYSLLPTPYFLMQAPKIDQRSYEDIVAYTEACAKAFTDWRPLADEKPDAGRSLIRVC
ncbi:MAG: hypothetical protein F6K53_35075, partial [Moorea sp. SIO4A1]|nr:hypothetical protein [Moorena sp. SIO4A1]